MTGNVDILNSWKEIAQYVGRGVRTVQRWERDMGLPVRRPRGRQRSAVIALRSDLDAWLTRCPVRNLGVHVHTDGVRKDLRERGLAMQAMAARLMELAEQNRRETQRALDLLNRSRAGGASRGTAGAT